jgi:hypothetical protein
LNVAVTDELLELIPVHGTTVAAGEILEIYKLTLQTLVCLATYGSPGSKDGVGNGMKHLALLYRHNSPGIIIE